MKTHRPPAKRGAGFTLMEIMVVVAIIGLVAAMSVPAILSMRREAPLRKAVNDVLEICSRARAGAVLNNTIATVLFQPRTGKVAALNADSNSALATRLGQVGITATQFDPTVTVEALGINLKDRTLDAAAPVNFYSNGTCDEMTLILLSGGEREEITLELTTGLATVKAL